MLKGASVPVGELLRRLWADPRFRKVVIYLAERALYRIIDRVEKKLKQRGK